MGSLAPCLGSLAPSQGSWALIWGVPGPDPGVPGPNSGVPGPDLGVAGPLQGCALLTSTLARCSVVNLFSFPFLLLKPRRSTVVLFMIFVLHHELTLPYLIFLTSVPPRLSLPAFLWIFMDFSENRTNRQTK